MTQGKQHTLKANFLKVHLRDGGVEHMPWRKSMPIPSLRSEYVKQSDEQAKAHRKTASTPFEDLDDFMKYYKWAPVVEWYGKNYENKYRKRLEGWDESLNIKPKKEEPEDKIIDYMKGM